ncbi:c-type cytochrome [Diaphorobacter aerolatus]|uniref:Cytochrome c n=1 Tax=Diaphorobacter aerolatus TaxID=1288495 RepID=A0A7H0GJS9_9BURK|nr:cytochrome c [Diaphorobacter aerolatus]QNP48545.1 cytochrome c [Diaphorobacter aerolatus]
MKRSFAILTGLIAVAAIGGVAVYQLNRLDESPVNVAEAVKPTAELVSRGEYLARVGNCMACHTVPGGAAFAGGRAIETPFGVIYSTNLTPHSGNGIGAWSSAEFWRAMHNGRSKDGRLLYPAFPYTSYTQVTREDSDAIWAYLRSQPPSDQANRMHALDFPFNTQVALAGWRAVFFRPEKFAPQTAKTPEWNRGAYLAQGLGHCAACHTPRNVLGATQEGAAFRGGLIPVQNWYAPALNAPQEAGVAEWPVADIQRLLQVGVSPHGSVSGPMAEVVFRSTQHLSDADARAMAVYLRELPQQQVPVTPSEPPASSSMELGAKVYRQYCAECHGEKGQGDGESFPALAGNRAVIMHSPTNVVRMVLQGGYQPATAANPRPQGMPPFLHVLGDKEIAAVVTYIRNAWDNRASSLDATDVYRTRERRGS